MGRGGGEEDGLEKKVGEGEEGEETEMKVEGKGQGQECHIWEWERVEVFGGKVCGSW